MSKKRIVDARSDNNGVITHVRFQGNQRFTSVERAIPIAERGAIEDVHVVHSVNARTHLRTDPDGRRMNNLDEMANS